MKDCDNIASLAISNGVESTGVTNFVQEACEAVDVLGKHYVGSALVSEQSEFQDLTQYFKRPRMIGNGALPTSVRNNVFNTQLTANVIFASYFLNGFQRLSGVFGVRFKLVYTLQVAATPFHQGILALSFQYGNQNSTYTRCSQSATATNIPHVRLDLSTDTMVQLSVPYLAVPEFMSLGSSFEYGTVALNIIGEIPSVAGLEPPTYRLYVHLEQLELIGASPQATVTTTLQSGKTLSPIEKEFESEAYPLSSSVAAASRSLRFLARGVPSISSIAGPTSWFLQKASGAIRAFGYARPLVQTPALRMQPMTNVFENNVDVPGFGTMVGPMASNHLAVSPSFGATDVDEMSLAYVLSQYSQICYGAMNTGDTASTVLYASPVTPQVMWFRAPSGPRPYCNVRPLSQPTGNNNAFIPSTLFFFSTMFRFWKGGFKYRFTFAKTKFHGGRVMASYIPYSAPSGATWGLPTPGTVLSPEALGGNTQPFGYSAIFDLRDGNVFEFEVPYASPLPWAQLADVLGSITLSVIDPLQAPGVVSTSINFIVEVCGASDFALACPIGPIIPANPVAPTIQLQSGKFLSTQKNDVAQHTIGEEITSVKQLITIPATVPSRVIGAGTIAAQTVFPWWYHRTQAVSVPNTTAPVTGTFTFGGNIACCYAFVRGGTDVHVYPITASTGAFALWAAFASYPYETTFAAVAAPNNRPGSSLSRVYVSDGNPVHLRFPAWQQVQRFQSNCVNGINWEFGFTNTGPSIVGFPTNALGPTNVPKFWYTNQGTAGMRVLASRQAADDAALAMYMGPPPVLMTTAAGSVWDPDSVQNQ